MGGMLGRMLLVARGGAFPIGGSGEDNSYVVSTAPDGGWIWFGGPNAVTYGGASDNDYTAVGYIDGTGDVEIRVVTNATQQTTDAVLLRNAWQSDDHNQPTLLVRSSDRRLLVVYSQHSSNTIRMRLSVSSVDDDPLLEDGFGTDTGFSAQLGATAYSYPSLLEYDGTLYLVVRSTSRQTGRWSYATATDTAGALPSWSTLTHFFQSGSGYVRVALDSDDGVFHFVVSNSSPNIATTHLGHMKWDRTTWMQSDGTTIGGATPHNLADATSVYNAQNSWMYDMVVDGSGNPVIGFYSYEGGEHHARYAKWSGSAWSNHLIADTGEGIKTEGFTGIQGGYYPGGAAIDPTDVDVVYVSGQTDTLVWEITKYVTADSGATWTPTTITANSTVKNVRPIVPANRHANCRALWMKGTYDDYTDWSTGISATAT